ncbi:hypothetical protein [Gallibacterium anatis]|uniref:hypothetical protein n=1 Tax=Gallibacterium anatis TaxID=750 RepID=UPI0039FCADB3
MAVWWLFGGCLVAVKSKFFLEKIAIFLVAVLVAVVTKTDVTFIIFSPISHVKSPFFFIHHSHNRKFTLFFILPN